MLLLLPIVIAAQVTEEGSGITRGSIEYNFVYDPADTETTVVDNVRPNDLITITYGTSKTRLPLKYEMFFKTFREDAWYYDVLKGERNLMIPLQGTKEIDINKDGTADYVMKLSAYEMRVGTFTFTPVHLIEAEPEPVEEPAEEVVNESSGFDDLGLVEEDEPIVVPPPTPQETLPETVPPIEVEQESNTVLIVVGIILLLALIGAIFYTLTPESKEGKKKDAKHVKIGGIRLKK